MPSHQTRNPWEAAQDSLKEHLDEYSYKNWFASTRYVSYEEGELVVGVPSQFFGDWLRDHYMDAIVGSLTSVLPDFRQVRFEPVPETAESPTNGAAHPEPVSRRAGVAAKQQLSGFNPRCTFGRFVVGAGNRFAYAAAEAVAESPGKSYNPLFFYGETGLGKTHLMQAIGHKLLLTKPDSKVVYISSEDFTNQLIQSIAEKSTQRFRARYRKVDVLLIDDIHFIAGKEATQEEFFHTFNALFDMHKHIVMTSDRSPKDIQGIETRLVSRFAWGLVTDIQPPDLETRVAILHNRTAQVNRTVSSDVLRRIATHVTTNIRELEGALTTVLAWARLENGKLTLDMVDEILRTLVKSEDFRPITFEHVQRTVAEHFDLRIADLRGRSRQRQVVVPRQIAMYLCKTLIPSMSLSDIGEAFGGKDHTTVLHSCGKIFKESRKDPAFRQTLDRLTKTIRA